MNLVVEPTLKLSGIVKSPPSKSYTIRAVTAGMLAEGTSVIKDPLYSEDTKACMQISEKLGAELKKDGNDLKITGVVGLPRMPKTTLDSLNSGTTIRLMTAVASLCNCKVRLTGDESIRRRPIKPLLDALEQLGVKTESNEGYPPVLVHGPLQGGVCNIRGDVSSQFISALLMALPCANKNSEINVIGSLKSTPYIDLTLDMLERFKVLVNHENHTHYIISGDQTYQSTNYTVEGDYSSAAFILAAASLTESDITVKNLFSGSKQADKKFVSILQAMGASLQVGDDYVRVKGNGSLKGIDVDLGHSPDLLPITAAVGALAEGKMRIYNTAHARIKECDRIKAMYTELRKMGAEIKENPDGLEITGGKLKGTLVEGWKDHRIVMALAVAALKAEGKTTITDKEYMAITFPNFTELLNKIGSKIQ